MQTYRQLAAIMFTDIAGYTAMMGEDEQKAFQLLYKNRTVQQPLIQQYNGIWIKELGDGVLASFSTATDAIHCALAIQKACSEIADLKLRIGIHLGEVVFENNDVFGDGVNIASRIQALAPVGGVWISESVYQTIANKKTLVVSFVKAEKLKNVKDPIRIFEVSTETPVPDPPKKISGQIGSSQKFGEKSVAVLPFIDLSDDHSQEYFGDGIAEEIINSLAHLEELKVAGRTSSFQFKGEKADLKSIGAKLNVENVLEGSIRKHGNRLRIMAQLVNVDNGYHLWSERFDRTIDDIFAIQDEIALAVTEKLRITLLQKDRDRITKTYTQNSVAYELYLKGRFHINRRGASIITGMQFFMEAIKTDPDFALPYLGFADGNLLLALYGIADPRQVMPRAKQAADKALALEPNLGEAYCSLGLYYTCYEWNWTEGKKYFLKSIDLNPRYAEVHYRYGWNYLCWIEGRFDEAISHGQKCIELEPLSSICYGTYSLILHTAGEFKKALVVCRSGIELDSNSFICRVNEGSILMALGRYDEAIESCKLAMSISNRHSFALNGLIWNYCLSGKMEEARILMDEIRERLKKEYMSKTFAAISAAYLNEVDEAFAYLEKAFEEKDPVILTMKHETWLPPALKADPRVNQLLDRINFPVLKNEPAAVYQ